MSVSRPGQLAGEITTADSGGFTAVASTGDLDRDNERVAPGAMNPLPASVIVHADHSFTTDAAIARGRPYYVGEELWIDATFASTPDAQVVRQKIIDGVLDSVSIAFRGSDWRDIDGVRTCVKAELLSVDVVSVPSNRGARILSMRSHPRPHAVIAHARRVCTDALVAAARAEIVEAKALLQATDTRGPVRRRTDALLREASAVNEPVSTTVRRFLRSIE